MTDVVVATTFVKRCDIEDGVGGHRLARGGEGALAKCLLVEDAGGAADGDDRARQPMLARSRRR